jgi:light-regulated signal transduction histidine kinase (bacteriophytochrome)
VVIEIGAKEDQHRVVPWMRDNGIGFDMKFHDRVFDIFQWLKRSEDYPGTGTGLVLVRNAIQHMDGCVWAESAEGEGATFYVDMPR